MFTPVSGMINHPGRPGICRHNQIQSPMTDTDLETRIIELETRISHLDQAMTDMSMMVKRQWDRIDVLERRNHLLGEDMKRMNDFMQTAPEDDVPPPHY